MKIYYLDRTDQTVLNTSIYNKEKLKKFINSTLKKIEPFDDYNLYSIYSIFISSPKEDKSKIDSILIHLYLNPISIDEQIIKYINLEIKENRIKIEFGEEIGNFQENIVYFEVHEFKTLHSLTNIIKNTLANYYNYDEMFTKIMELKMEEI